MGFYEQISEYYDYIFPVGKEQLNFLKESFGLPTKKLLDVACGSGGYSLELSREGYVVTAVDIDDEMVRMAKEKASVKGIGIEVFKSDMKELGKAFQPDFDGIFCIGNSIVHLGSVGEIKKVIRDMYKLLSDNGVLILQIINFDRIMRYGINELPTIKNNVIGLEFIRKYEYTNEKGKIDFNTILITGKGKERFENSIELFPVLSSDMTEGLKDAGFKEIELYGDFNNSEYNENSFMLVARAKK